MNQNKVIVLGANGPVGKNTIQALKKSEYSDIVAFSRSYNNVTQDGVFFKKGDLEHSHEVLDALKDCEIAFVTVGVEYNHKVWEKTWPVIVDNIIQACLENQTRLVFFDNIYSYGLVKGAISEDLPHNPISKKGKVRQLLNEKITEAGKKGLQYIIAKSGEFYGDGVKASSLYNSCLENIVKDKNAFWIGDLSKLRTYTHIHDVAKAMVLLAQDEQAYNQVWHLPTQSPLTGNQFVEVIENILGRKVKISAMNKRAAWFLSFFIKPLRELLEMYYQFENDYVLDSRKFSKHYPDFKVTEYKVGLEKMITWIKNDTM